MKKYRVISDDVLEAKGLDPKDFNRCLGWWDDDFIINLYKECGGKSTDTKSLNELIDYIDEVMHDMDYHEINNILADKIKGYIKDCE